MIQAPIGIDEERAVERLLRFLSIEGITGRERAIGQEVVAALGEAGVPRAWIRFDEAHHEIPLPTETGNLIIDLPGTRSGPRRLMMTHLDTVPLCAGAKPLVKGKRIVAAGRTGLGADNRTGVACLVALIETLIAEKLPHPPLTVLFTVREESGLWGARFVKPEDLGNPVEGFNFDGGLPSDVTVGAVGADRWEVEIRGKAAHAGVRPERGISATMVAALALAEIHQNGWFGKVVQGGLQGTSNVGSFGAPEGGSAGEASNVVTDRVLIRGEARSHHLALLRRITAAYKRAFQDAALRVVNDEGKRAKVRFTAQREYHGFRIKDNAPVVRHAHAAVRRAGLTPSPRLTNGGLDANWLTRHGIPTVTFGAGQHNVHTLDEYVEISEFLDGCRVALAAATLED